MDDEAIGLDARLQESERPTARRAVLSANGAHILHDGLTDVLYVFFPIWQGSLGLDYSAIGALKACYSGAMASLQLSAARLADRVGNGTVLAGGTVIAGLGFLAAAYVTGFPWLVAALLFAGAGASAQHPLASDLVARSTPALRARQALGIFERAAGAGCGRRAFSLAPAGFSRAPRRRPH